MRNFWSGLIVIGIIIISLWLQQNILNNVPLFGVKANICIVFVVALSIMCGSQVGMTVGITYGILSDILFGKAFGIYTLLYFLLGFFFGFMSKGFSKENKTTLVLITMGATLAFELISYLLFVVVYSYDFEIINTIKTIALEIVYNVLIARLCYKFLNFISEMINKGKRGYYLL